MKRRSEHAQYCHGLCTYLVRQLVTKDGDRRAEAAGDAVGEGGPDGQPVTEVVNSVPEDDHPGYGRYGVRHLGQVRMSMTMTMTMTSRVTVVVVRMLGIISSGADVAVVNVVFVADCALLCD